MIKKKIIKFAILLLLISGCGYSPIFSNKDSNFSVYELSTNGNNKLNKIINNRLNSYKGLDGRKQFSLIIETNLNKQIASKNIKGNPKTYKISVVSKLLVKDKQCFVCPLTTFGIFLVV